MIKEQVLKALRNLGFIPEEVEGFGYRFDYESLTFLYSVDDDDSECVTLSLPDVFDISDDNRVAVLEAMAKLSRKIRYVQPYIAFEDQVWLNYVYFTDGNEVTESLIEHMVSALAVAMITFRKILNGEYNDD